MARRKPDQVDKIVGRNVRICRLQKGLSQTDLAIKLGITFQQIQKYEKGTNRIASGRLLKIASLLSVPLILLFKGSEIIADTNKQSVFDQLAEPHGNRLVQAFAKIRQDATRRSVVRLVEEIVKTSR
jgi:transcriptional regulator with XRE-family HTH domain